MKIHLQIIALTLSLLWSGIGYCQSTPEISTGWSFLSRDQDRIYALSNSELKGENKRLDHLFLEQGKRSKDTFSFRFFDYKVQKNLSYKFIIRLFEQDSIQLIPISKAAKEFYDFREEIWFYRQKYFFDNSIVFEKLYFHSGIDSNINSNISEIFIDSSGHTKLRRRNVWDNIPKDYVGELTTEGKQMLISYLKLANLKSLYWSDVGFPGMDPKQLIIYFNGHKKVLSTRDETPYVVMDLILFFINLEKYSNLHQVTERIVF